MNGFPDGGEATVNERAGHVVVQYEGVIIVWGGYRKEQLQYLDSITLGLKLVKYFLRKLKWFLA